MRKKWFSILLSALLVLSLAACAEKDSAANSSTTQPVDESGSVKTETSAADQLTVRFGDSGAPFTMYLEDNDTAAAIARHVGSADWRLPIYHYDDYDGWESFQYYDIPSRYEVPSAAETVTPKKLEKSTTPSRTGSCCSTMTPKSPGSTRWSDASMSRRSSLPL